jgi:hypothetical protein
MALALPMPDAPPVTSATFAEALDISSGTCNAYEEQVHAEDRSPKRFFST